MSSLEDISYLTEFSMDNSKNETRINFGTILALVLLGGVLFYFSVTMAFNTRLEDDLTREKLESELLLSEKLSQQKENLQLVGELKKIDERYKQVNSNLKSALEQLALKEKELKKAKSWKTDACNQEQKEEIAVLYEKIKTDSVDNKMRFNEANAYSSILESKLSNKTSEMEQYIYTIERLRRLRINDLKTETMSKKNKLTSKASKTKSIKISLQVSDQLENLTFQIIDPSGKKLLSTEKNSSLLIKDNEGQSPVHAFIANLDIQVNAIEEYKKVEIIYTSTKLTPGVYKITLLSEQEIIGNCFLRLE